MPLLRLKKPLLRSERTAPPRNAPPQLATRFIGVDLAWGEGTAGRAPNETGFAVLDESGQILDAGWTRGVDETVEWLASYAIPGSLIAIDAPLVVTNAIGMRDCEREVANGYMRWKVGANASNTSRGWQAGVALRGRLEAHGFTYIDGLTPAKDEARSFFECYPYTTLVGMEELGYDFERPRYKRFIPGLTPEHAREERARQCDELIRRVAQLKDAVPPVDLTSHPVTRQLVEEPSPIADVAYKHREDLLDAVICAWTAAIWSRFGAERTQVLGAGASPDEHGRRPTIVAPARPEQRVSDRPRPPRPRGGPDVTTPTSADAALDEVIRLLKAVDSIDPLMEPQLIALEREAQRLRAQL